MSSNLAWDAATRPIGGWRASAWVAVLLVLPQLPFWAARADFSLDRPLFNLDLALATLIACAYRRTGMVLLVFAWIVDIARAASLNYHFISPVEFVATAKFADMVVLRQVLSWKLLLAVAGLMACFACVARLVKRPLMPGLLVGMLMLQLLDLANGSSQLFGWGADRFRVQANIAGSPSWNIVQAERHAVALARMPMTPYEHPRTFEAITAWHQRHPEGSVLLVLVESMGKPTSPEIAEWLGRRLATPALASRWTLRQHADDFYGPTTSGELRVLCGLRGSYAGLKPKDEAGCLPNRWKAEGREAHGLHGFHLRMFDRLQWWPRIGLTPWRFDPDAETSPRFGCNGAFPGVCDDAVLDAAVRLVDQPSRFVYALTLDTHLPMSPGHEVPADLAALCVKTRTNDVACQMVAQLGTVLDVTAAKVSSLVRPPLVVIVGDHSPPFAVSESRQAFDQTQVPLYVLTPKEDIVGR
jgi:hypothetical protein